MGLAKGSSLENAVVIHNGHVMNPEGTHYANEMVRHKILDAIGDLYLCGVPMQGRLISHNGGHEMNNRILRLLFQNADAYRLIAPTQQVTSPVYAAVIAQQSLRAS
jgi:UDP-3-O-[3-hydroxymyristoyl] N-acetylglucosamine deacetylase